MPTILESVVLLITPQKNRKNDRITPSCDIIVIPHQAEGVKRSWLIRPLQNK